MILGIDTGLQMPVFTSAWYVDFDDFMKFRQMLIFLVKLFMLLVRDMSVNFTLNIYMCFHIA